LLRLIFFSFLTLSGSSHVASFKIEPPNAFKFFCPQRLSYNLVVLIRATINGCPCVMANLWPRLMRLDLLMG